MFNEVQAMRQEIAELRDMVERQQFELRKLKAAQQPQTNNRAVDNRAYSATGYPTSPQPNSGGQTSAAPQNREVNAYPAATQAPSVSAASQSRSSLPPQSDSDFYRPYNAAVDTAEDRDTVAESASAGAPVSATVITAPPLQTQGRQDTGYPPVEERSVGGVRPENSGVRVTAAQSIPQSSPVRSGDLSTANTAADVPPFQQAPLATGSAATVYSNTASSGVVSVPNASANEVAGSAGSAAVINTAPITNTQAAQNNSVATPQTGLPAPTQVITPSASQTGVQNNAGAVATPQAQPSAKPALAENDYYSQGFNLLKQSKHADAVRVFEQQIEAYPQGEYADDAYYWIAESMYVNRNLDLSKKNFKSIIDNYKQSPRLPDAMLKTAYIEQDQGNLIEAQLLLQEILQFHPRSNAAISAKNRLAEMKN